MNPSALSQIEADISQLSFTEQLWLLERIAQRLRTQCATPNAFEHQLAAMAADQEVQQEIRSIEEEFTHAAADGLDTP